MSVASTTTTPFWADLGRRAAQPALHDSSGTVSYDDLAARVDEARHRLGAQRKLTLLHATNDIDTVVWQLAALDGRHPLLVVDDRSERVQHLFDPDVVIAPGGELEIRREKSDHDLHPELALLLSTSGSTGSPKLVRLSRRNLASNASAIASYLSLQRSDVGVTSLPLHYCYGLSVLNSHLAVGASVALTGASVVDPCFWSLCDDVGVTGIAGVPHTFTLLDSVGLADVAPATLRYLTQAGGRLEPDSVRRHARLCADRGWELFVMYGQTEATARMAYLPPSFAEQHPSAVGVAIPGGRITIDTSDHSGRHADEGPTPAGAVGEIVYRGPNVMMGYAETTDELALGHTLDELRTGDLGRFNSDGLLEIVGRRSRFAKIAGLRIDLDEVERDLGRRGIDALCASDDRVLCVATTGDVDEVAGRLASLTGLPRTFVDVAEVDVLPTTSTGKHDHHAVLQLARQRSTPAGRAGKDVRSVLAASLLLPRSRTISPDDTFVSLGGDSLSYVEVSAALEEQLGRVPRDWHVMPVGALERMATAARNRRRRRWKPLDSSAVLRAVAIVLIVGNHTDLWLLPGGAHVLLAAAGYNLARFQLAARSPWPAVGRIVAPSVVWIGLVAAVGQKFGLTNALLIRSYAGPDSAPWSYWFIETLVALLVGVALTFSIPAVRRFDARRPLALPLGLLVVGLLIRFDVIPLPTMDLPLFRPHEVLWLLSIGWAGSRTSNVTGRLILAAIALAGAAGFSGNDSANLVLGAGLVTLLLIPTLPVPRLAAPPVITLASASLHIYLVHWQVFPLLEEQSAMLATAVSLGAGVTAWWVWTAIAAGARRWPGLKAGPSRRSARERAALSAPA